MQFSSVLLFVSSASALGINCRGSFMCNTNPGASLQSVHDQIGNLIASGGGERRFNQGGAYIAESTNFNTITDMHKEQIACSHGSQGSFCAFYQSGASGSAKDAYNQVQQLLDHGTCLLHPQYVIRNLTLYLGCGGCGSVPTVQDGSNDVSKGQLTVNYVTNPSCEGTCDV